MTTSGELRAMAVDVKSSETERFAAAATLDCLTHLERNDFTHLAHLGYCLLSAKDGKKSVIVWIDTHTEAPTLLLVPVHVVQLAQKSDARLDVLKCRVVDGGKVDLRHTMNVMG